MKKNFILLISILVSNIALADDLIFKPSYSAGLGYQTGPLSGENTNPYVVVKTYLLQDPQLERANLLGFGLSLNTKGQAQVVVSPLSLVVDKIYVSPEIGIGLGSSPMKIGMSVSYGF